MEKEKQDISEETTPTTAMVALDRDNPLIRTCLFVILNVLFRYLAVTYPSYAYLKVKGTTEIVLKTTNQILRESKVDVSWVMETFNRVMQLDSGDEVPPIDELEMWMAWLGIAA